MTYTIDRLTAPGLLQANRCYRRPGRRGLARGSLHRCEIERPAPGRERWRIALAIMLFVASSLGSGCRGDEPMATPSPATPPPPEPQTPAGAFTFEPSPPVPEDVDWGHEGTFAVFLDGSPYEDPGDLAAVSTNSAVLPLRKRGNGYWDWRAVEPGASTVEIRHEDRVVLTHEVQTPLQEHDRHHLMLRAVMVNEDWTPFVAEGDGAWDVGVPLKESPNLKYVEAVLWEEIRAVHVYEFPVSFNPHRGLDEDITPEEYTAYRESFRVLAFPGMPLPPPHENSSPEVSRFLRETFKRIANYLVSRYPDSEHHLNYHGHGAAGGRLFEFRLTYDDAADMLAHWTQELGRPLGVIDMGGPCNKSGYEDLTNFCRFAQYYVASDMPQGNYSFDEWTREKFQETNAELQYHRLFRESEELRTVLAARIDLNRLAFEYSRNDMVKKRWPQATYLHSCADFEPFARDFIAFVNHRGVSFDNSDDVLHYLETGGAGASLVQAFRRVLTHRVDNRDFFEWAENRNGMTMPHPDWWNARYR